VAKPGEAVGAKEEVEAVAGGAVKGGFPAWRR
jgi:hypothetical protein